MFATVCTVSDRRKAARSDANSVITSGTMASNTEVTPVSRLGSESSIGHSLSDSAEVFYVSV
jgi:hypothetical protein